MKSNQEYAQNAKTESQENLSAQTAAANRARNLRVPFAHRSRKLCKSVGGAKNAARGDAQIAPLVGAHLPWRAVRVSGKTAIVFFDLF